MPTRPASRGPSRRFSTRPAATAADPPQSGHPGYFTALLQGPISSLSPLDLPHIPRTGRLWRRVYARVEPVGADLDPLRLTALSTRCALLLCSTSQAAPHRRHWPDQPATRQREPPTPRLASQTPPRPVSLSPPTRISALQTRAKPTDRNPWTSKKRNMFRWIVRAAIG